MLSPLNEIIQLQLLICGLNFLEPAVDEVLCAQARAAHEMFVWGIKYVLQIQGAVWSSWPIIEEWSFF